VTDQIFVGVYVAKDWLNIHHASHGAARINNSPAAARSLAVRCAKEGAWVVFEASDGYDRQLRDALESAQVRFSRINPRQARDFAGAMGAIGKTDHADARMLTELGNRLTPAQTQPLPPERRALQAQATRRRQLFETRKQEATRLQQTADPVARTDIRGVIALLDRRMAKIEARITDLVSADTELAAIDRRLRTAPGVGPVVAATLIAELPELGQIDRRRTRRPRSHRARQRAALKPSIHRRRSPDRQDHPLSRSPPGVAPLSRVHPLPGAPPGSREIRQGRHHRHRQEARHHPQCHARVPHRLSPRNCCLITVAGKIMNKTKRPSMPSLKRPKFMSHAMWFVFLLRGELRGGLPPSSEEAQRDFVAWWLCFGKREYPSVWAWRKNHLSIAMEKTTATENIILPRMLRYIHKIEDINRQFPLRDEEDVGRFLSWYRIFGSQLFDLAPPLPGYSLVETEVTSNLPPWNRIKFPLPRVAAALIEFGDHKLQEALDFGHAPQDVVLEFCHGGWRQFLAEPAPLVAEATAPLPVTPYIFRQHSHDRDEISVNLVGYARGELGVGEDVRMVSSALDSVNIRHAIIDISEFLKSARKNDSFAAHDLSDTPIHDITIYCMPMFDLARLYLDVGKKFFKGQYKIGYFPWELPGSPAGWSDVYDLVDEIWAPSTFIAQAFGSDSRKPVHLMPPAVSLPPIALHSKKEFLQNGSEAFVFVYPFDPNSHLSRKNPIALVRAFRKAFDENDNTVALLLRVNGDPRGHPGWEELEDAASADSRIHTWLGTLDRPDALGILASCDCLVSPHRAEGFGRNIAEAILLGLPVLATGFSGNVDFMEPEELIAWTPRALAPGDYPFGEGMWWAEPDVADMARKMMIVRERLRDFSWPASIPSQRKKRMEDQHSPASAGRRYARRLQDILSWQGARARLSPR